MEDATSLLVHEVIFVALDRQIAFWMAGVPGLYPGYNIMYLGTSLVVPYTLSPSKFGRVFV